MKLTLLPLHNDKVVRLACEGEMGRLFNPDEEPLRSLLGPSCYSLRVLLDLERAQSIDTSGLGWLLNVSTKFLRAGGKLVLHTVPPLISQVLSFVQVTDMVFLAADEPSAREAALAEESPDAPALTHPSRPLEEFQSRKIS